MRNSGGQRGSEHEALGWWSSLMIAIMSIATVMVCDHGDQDSNAGCTDGDDDDAPITSPRHLTINTTNMNVRNDNEWWWSQHCRGVGID